VSELAEEHGLLPESKKYLASWTRKYEKSLSVLDIRI
jgi:hypothetical protein